MGLSNQVKDSSVVIHYFIYNIEYTTTEHVPVIKPIVSSEL